MEESKKYVDSNLIQTATTTANSLCKYKGVIPTTTSSISGQQKYPFCSNLAEITPKLVQYLHSGQNISLDAVKNDAVHEQVWIDGWSWDQHQRTPGINLWYTSLWEYSKKKACWGFSCDILCMLLKSCLTYCMWYNRWMLEKNVHSMSDSYWLPSAQLEKSHCIKNLLLICFSC